VPDRRDGDHIRPLIREIHARRGRPTVVALSTSQVQTVVDRLYYDIDDDRVEVRLLLGRAATTASAAGAQIVAALQLPYIASHSWDDLLAEIDERSVSRREFVVVADAADLLRDEDPDKWRELVWSMCGGPYCLGGGWQSVVLIDEPLRWEQSRFGGVAGARAAVERLFAA